MQFHIITPADALWQRVCDYAAACSWSAGKFLAAAMTRGDFTDWERVIAATQDDQICGYCTVAGRDCIPSLTVTPFVGYVFVGELFRGQRLSERMIDHASAYLASVGFDRVHLVSDQENLYEKYGFVIIDRRTAPWGTMQKIYMRPIRGEISDE